MLPPPLRHAFRSPLPALAAGFRFWRRQGARLRWARTLCQAADGLRLRRVRGWETRSRRLYRRSVRSLGDLASPVEAAAQDNDPALAARRALRRAAEPYRAFLAGFARLAIALATVTSLVLIVGCVLSASFRTRLFPRDLAAGRPWTASSADNGMAASGVGPSSEAPLFFHTTNSLNPWIEIDLGGEHVIRSVLVENRRECCQERALPLNVEVWNGDAWQLVAQRRTTFSVWKYDVGPIRGQRIRFLHPGTNYLHLKRISVYGQ